MKFGKTLDYSMMLTAPVRESLQVPYDLWLLHPNFTSIYCGLTPVCLNSFLNVKVAAFNQENVPSFRRLIVCSPIYYTIDYRHNAGWARCPRHHHHADHHSWWSPAIITANGPRVQTQLHCNPTKLYSRTTDCETIGDRGKTGQLVIGLVYASLIIHFQPTWHMRQHFMCPLKHCSHRTTSCFLQPCI